MDGGLGDPEQGQGDDTTGDTCDALGGFDEDADEDDIEKERSREKKGNNIDDDGDVNEEPSTWSAADGRA